MFALYPLFGDGIVGQPNSLSRMPQLAAGGDDGIRTHDPLLAGQVLSQLSYTPIGGNCSTLVEQLCVGIDLSSRTVARKVLSTLVSLTSVFGMGTGGPSPFVTPTIQFYCSGFDP